MEVKAVKDALKILKNTQTTGTGYSIKNEISVS